MADPKDAAQGHQQLQVAVKSKILQQIHDNLTSGARLADTTQYVKSDGTNYGMYTRSDPNSTLGDIWERVFPVAATTHAATGPVVAPGTIKGSGGGGG